MDVHRHPVRQVGGVHEHVPTKLTAMLVVAAAKVIVDRVQVDDLILVDDVPVRQRRHDDGGRRVVEVILHVAAKRGCGLTRRRE